MGFLEITPESFFLNFKRIETPSQFLTGGLADLGDLLFEFLKLGFCFLNFQGKR